MKIFLSLDRIFGMTAIIIAYIANHINCVNVIDEGDYVNFSKVIACIIVFVIAQVLAWVGVCIKKQNNKIFNHVALIITFFWFTGWAGYIMSCGPMPYIV